jgi:hypothetical protein
MPTHDGPGTSAAVISSTAEASKRTFPVGTSNLAALGSGAVGWNALAEAVSNLEIEGDGEIVRLTFNENEELIEFVSTARGNSVYFDEGVSAIEILSDVDVARFIYAVVNNQLIIDGAVTANAEYYLSAESVLRIVSSIEFINDYWDGWAYNLNTGAPSFYEDFKFNSFAKIGTEYYGLNDNGIHLLGADDDDGEEIDALITTGKSDYNDDHTKKIPIIYAGVKSDQPMLLTARVDNEPDYTYEFTGGSEKLSRCRVKLGRGLEGSYWQIEIANKNGGDFEIDSIDLPIIPNSRRV